MESVTIGDSVSSVGIFAFEGCSSLIGFYGKLALGDNRCLIIDGVLNSFALSGLTEYSIPNSVTSIGDYALYYCSGLISLTIPDSVTSIGEGSFSNCKSLLNITIPDSVTSIGTTPFWQCNSLRKITIGSNIATIGHQTFETGCSHTNWFCRSTTPPKISDLWFMCQICKIYVPRQSVNAYKSADGWKDYAKYIEGYDF